MSDMILGLNDGHNAAAALLDNGRIVAAVQEERLTRNKNESGVPHRSIEHLFSMTGISGSSVRRVALNGTYMTFGAFDREPLLDEYEQSGGLAVKLKQPLKGTIVDELYKRGKG